MGATVLGATVLSAAVLAAGVLGAAVPSAGVLRAGAQRGVVGGSGSASEITSWVSSHFTSQTVGGQTIYDLTKATS